MESIVELLKEKNKTIAAMESCTGGEFTSQLTNVEGSSQVIKFSAVTYANQSKIMLGVSEDTIKKYSVYSTEVAKEMSNRISKIANSNYGIGISGTLNRVDPNNIVKDNNLVYYAIYDNDMDKYYSDIIKLKSMNRIDAKKEVINIIKDKLKEILE